MRSFCEQFLLKRLERFQQRLIALGVDHRRYWLTVSSDDYFALLDPIEKIAEGSACF